MPEKQNARMCINEEECLPSMKNKINNNDLSEDQYDDQQNINNEQLQGVFAALGARAKLANFAVAIIVDKAGRSQVIKILLDNGNSVACLISNAFHRQLGLSLLPSSVTARAAGGHKLEILGRSENILLKFPGLPAGTTFRWSPLVVKGLSHQANLSLKFMEQNEIDLQHRSGERNWAMFHKTGTRIRLVSRQHDLLQLLRDPTTRFHPELHQALKALRREKKYDDRIKEDDRMVNKVQRLLRQVNIVERQKEEIQKEDKRESLTPEQVRFDTDFPPLGEWVGDRHLGSSIEARKRVMASWGAYHQMKKQAAPNNPKIYVEQQLDETQKTIQQPDNKFEEEKREKGEREEEEEHLQPEPIRTSSEVIISPGSQQFIEVQVCLNRGMVNLTPYMEDPRLPQGIIIPKAVLTVDKEKSIIIMYNTSDLEHSIPKNTVVGFGNYVAMVAEVEEGEDFTDQAKAKVKPEDINEDWVVREFELDDNEILQEKPHLREQLISMLIKHGQNGVFAGESHTSDPGPGSNLVECQLVLKPGASDRPINIRPRPLHPQDRADLDRQLDTWLATEVITPSKSPWSFPLVAVRKKNMKIKRWTLDLRLANARCVSESTYIGSVHENLAELKQDSVFTQLDLAAGFHSIRVKEGLSRDLLSFATSHRGTFSFARMPFGLHTAAQTFARMMKLIMDSADIPSSSWLAYVDDVLIKSPSEEGHIDILDRVLKSIGEANCRVSVAKTKLLRRKVKYLGYLVSAGKLSMDPEYKELILNFPRPESGQALARFLGIVGFYQSYLVNLSRESAVLHSKKKEKPFESWTPEQDKAFRVVRTMVHDADSLASPDHTDLINRPFILQTDFSKTALGASLWQVQMRDGNWRECLLGAAGRKNTSSAQNYSSHHGELAALVFGTKKYHHHLLHVPFVVRTDSMSAAYLDSVKDVRGALTRWIAHLGQYSFSLEHRQVPLADAISRLETGLPHPSEEDEKFDREFSDEEGGEEEDKVHKIERTLLDQARPQGRRPDLENKNVEAIDARDTEKLFPGLLAPMTPSQVKQGQLDDPCLAAFHAWTREGRRPQVDEFRETLNKAPYHYYRAHFELLTVQDDGVLCSRLMENSNDNGALRVCIPPKLQEQAIKLAHCHTAAHYGISTTQRILKVSCLFPGQYRRVRDFVNNCQLCVGKMTEPTKKRHVLQPVTNPTSYPNHEVACDLVILPRTVTGFKYLLTMEDCYTRWVEAQPLKDKTSKAVANGLMDGWIHRHSKPDRIRTDRGLEFMGAPFEQALQSLQITHITGPAYNPQSNPVEAFHKILGSLLRALTPAQGQDRWDIVLPAVIGTYNGVVHSSTGQTPHMMTTGRERREALAQVWGYPRPIARSATEHLRESARALTQSFLAAAKHGGIVMRRRATCYTGKPPLGGDPVVNQLVFFWAPFVKGPTSQSKKLYKGFTGPWRITEVYSLVLVKITSEFRQSQLGKPEATKVVNVDRLLPYRHQTNTGLELSPDPTAADHNLPDVVSDGELEIDDEGTEIHLRPEEGEARVQRAGPLPPAPPLPMMEEEEAGDNDQQMTPQGWGDLQGNLVAQGRPSLLSAGNTPALQLRNLLVNAHNPMPANEPAERAERSPGSGGEETIPDARRRGLSHSPAAERTTTHSRLRVKEQSAYLQAQDRLKLAGEEQAIGREQRRIARQGPTWVGGQPSLPSSEEEQEQMETPGESSSSAEEPMTQGASSQPAPAVLKPATFTPQLATTKLERIMVTRKMKDKLTVVRSESQRRRREEDEDRAVEESPAPLGKQARQGRKSRKTP